MIRHRLLGTVRRGAGRHNIEHPDYGIVNKLLSNIWAIYCQYLEMLSAIPQYQYLVVSKSIFNDFLRLGRWGVA